MRPTQDPLRHVDLSEFADPPMPRVTQRRAQSVVPPSASGFVDLSEFADTSSLPSPSTRPPATHTSKPPLPRTKSAASIVPGWSAAADTDLQDFLSTNNYRVSSLGQSETHNRKGLDHRHAADVAVNPSSAEGQRLIAYLQERGIPHISSNGTESWSTGAHVHVGAESRSTNERFDVGETFGEADAPGFVDLSEFADPAPASVDLSEFADPTPNDDEVIDVPMTREGQEKLRLAGAQTTPQAPLPPMPHFDPRTLAGRNTRDRMDAAAASPNARLSLDVTLPSGFEDWSQVSGGDLVKQAVRQHAQARGIGQEFAEKFIAERGGDWKTYDLATGEAREPIDYIGNEKVYDSERRTMRVSQEMPILRELEEAHEASKGMLTRATDWATDADTSAGEKLLDVATPIVETAGNMAAPVVNRLGTLDDTIFTAYNTGSVAEGLRAGKQRLIEGTEHEQADNPLADAVRENLKDYPGFAKAGGFLTDLIASPSNLLGGAALKAVAKTGAAGRAVDAAGEALTARRLGGGGEVLNLSRVADELGAVADDGANVANAAKPRIRLAADGISGQGIEVDMRSGRLYRDGAPQPYMLGDDGVRRVPLFGADDAPDIRRAPDQAKVTTPAPVTDSPVRLAPETHSTPREVAPVPEALATLDAQLDAMRAGRRRAVLVTPGEALPEIPDGFTRTITEKGTFIHDPQKLTKGEIFDRVDHDAHGSLLGHVEPKSERTKAIVVATRKTDGTELQASYVSPENVERQAAELTRQFPGAQVEAGGANLEARVLAERATPRDPKKYVTPGQARIQYGSLNRLVTPERANVARANIRRKLNMTAQTNIGADPTVAGDMATLATFHLEAGARQFDDFALRMIEDGGEAVKPQLRRLWTRAHEDLGETPPSETAIGNTSATGQASAPSSGAAPVTPERTPVPEVISSLRKAGMLFGIKTHIRNIAGTGGFQVAEEAARVPAALADIVVSAVTGKRTVSGANLLATARSSREAATKGVREAWKIMREGVDEEGLHHLQVQGELHSGIPGVGNLVDFYGNTIFRSLSAEDRIFRTYALRRSLEDQARVIVLNEVNAKRISRAEASLRKSELVANPTPEMQAQALSDAEFATFNNDNFVTTNITGAVRDKLKTAGSKGRWAQAGIDLVLPFDRTPTNLVARILEYAGGLPASVGQLGYKAAARRITGRAFTDADQKAFAKTFGRGTTGAALIALGYKLAANDAATGTYDDERDEVGRNNVARAAGRPPMAARIGEVWHQIGGFSPLGNLIGIGATLYREQHQPLKDEAGRAGRIADIAKDVVMEQPLLSAAKDVFGEGGTVGDRAGRLAGSFIPQGVADAAGALDDKAREARGFTAQVKNRIPGVRETLPESEDVFGRPLEHRKSRAVDPTLSSTRRNGMVERELLRLNIGIGKQKASGDEMPESFRTRRREDGQELYSVLADFVVSPEYAAMTDGERRAELAAEIKRTRAALSKEREQ